MRNGERQMQWYIAMVASLLGVLAEQASAEVAHPPTLDPGDSYHYAFVTVSKTQATNSNISYYNTFVNDEATTYAGSPYADIDTLTWYCIGSTATVDAKDNAVITAPVYLLDGTRISDGTNMWAGLDANFNHRVDGNEAGTSTTDRRIWTGTDVDGTGRTASELGSGANVTKGWPLSTTSSWIESGTESGTASYRLFALSEAITIPLPDLFWSEASTISVSDTSVTVSAEINTNTTTTVLVWGENDQGTTNTTDWAPNVLSLGTKAAGTVTATITGLSPNTDYVWRLYASDGSNEAWVNPAMPARTQGPPFVSNTPPYLINIDSTTLYGTVTATNGGALQEVRIYFGDEDGGETHNWDTTYTLDVNAISENVAFSTNANPLTAGVTYFYRAYASNMYGEAWAPASSFTFSSVLAQWSFPDQGPTNQADLSATYLHPTVQGSGVAMGPGYSQAVQTNATTEFTYLESGQGNVVATGGASFITDTPHYGVGDYGTWTAGASFAPGSVNGVPASGDGALLVIEPADDKNSVAAATNNGLYVEFSVTAAGGDWNITDFHFDGVRNPDEPGRSWQTWHLQAQIDGSFTNLYTSPADAIAAGDWGLNVSADPFSVMVAKGESVTFRLLGTTTIDNQFGRLLQLDDLTLRGTVTPKPDGTLIIVR